MPMSMFTMKTEKLELEREQRDDAHPDHDREQRHQHRHEPRDDGAEHEHQHDQGRRQAEGQLARLEIVLGKGVHVVVGGAIAGHRDVEAGRVPGALDQRDDRLDRGVGGTSSCTSAAWPSRATSIRCPER